MNKIYNVSFPKLGINNLKISPIAFNIGNTSVRWYGIFIAVGFILGLLYILKRCTEFKLKKSNIENLVVICFIFSIIFARLYYVIFYPGDYYIKNPLKVFCINEGGIAIYGAIIGGFIAAWIYSLVSKRNFFSILDLMSMGLLIGQSIGRWGNFTNQEAFGSETNLPWGMVSENTLNIAVHPCFLYESLGCMIVFFILHVYSYNQKNLYPGKIFLLYMLTYSSIRVIIEGLRTDSLIIPGTCLRISQVLGILLVCVSSIWLIINKKKHLPN